MKLVLQGIAASKGKATGRVVVVMSTENDAEARLARIGKESILVTDVASPSWITHFKSIRGLVSDEGGLLCHAAILGRELKIPAVVGTKLATKILREGWLIMVDGDEGKIYKLNEDT